MYSNGLILGFVIDSFLYTNIVDARVMYRPNRENIGVIRTTSDLLYVLVLFRIWTLMMQVLCVEMHLFPCDSLFSAE